VLWCYAYIKETTLGENYKKAYKLWRDRNPATRRNMDAKALFNHKNYILKAKRITAVETGQIKENIRLNVGEDTENHTNRVNNGKIDTSAIEHQKGNQERNSTAAGKVETNMKHPSVEAEQHTFRDRFKEDIQITWHKVRPLKISERKKLPK
jgi:hypothetical protein